MTLNVALIGCGGIVRSVHLPNMMADPRLHVRAAVDLDLDAARLVANTSGAEYWTDDVGRAIADPRVDLVFIATPHHTHASLCVQAARAGKHIFCEKPMGLDEEECLAVAEAVTTAGVTYAAGYNRAVAPFVLRTREILAPLQAPMLIYHRVADWNPYGHGWPLDERKSGGRVIGEGGHGLDMICRLVGKDPVRVYAEGGSLAEPNAGGAPDSAVITLAFPDGSSGVELLSSVGNNAFPKEEIQITCVNHTIVIYAFQRMAVYGPEGEEVVSLPEADKGHRALLDLVARAITEGTSPPTGVGEALRASRCTFAALRSIRAGEPQRL